jgi:hypothetical protein
MAHEARRRVFAQPWAGVLQSSICGQFVWRKATVRRRLKALSRSFEGAVHGRSAVIFAETERGRRRGEEPYFLYGDDPRRRDREGIGEKHDPARPYRVLPSGRTSLLRRAQQRAARPPVLTSTVMRRGTPSFEVERFV